jgi:hypothetical protein
VRVKRDAGQQRAGQGLIPARNAAPPMGAGFGLAPEPAARRQEAAAAGSSSAAARPGAAGGAACPCPCSKPHPASCFEEFRTDLGPRQAAMFTPADVIPQGLCSGGSRDWFAWLCWGCCVSSHVADARRVCCRAGRQEAGAAAGGRQVHAVHGGHAAAGRHQLILVEGAQRTSQILAWLLCGKQLWRVVKTAVVSDAQLRQALRSVFT